MLMLKDNFNIQRDMSSSEASLPGEQQWAAREVARLARDRARGSPGRESTENIYLDIIYTYFCSISLFVSRIFNDFSPGRESTENVCSFSLLVFRM